MVVVTKAHAAGPLRRSRSRDRRRSRSRSPAYDAEKARRRPTWFDIPPIGGAPPPLTQLPGAVQVQTCRQRSSMHFRNQNARCVGAYTGAADVP